VSVRGRWLPLIACCVPLLAGADERILDYRSHIDVHADSSLDVVETIRVRAEGVAIRRGIFRDFPTRYVDRRGQRVVTGFQLLGVARDGRPEPHHEERRLNGVRVYVGDADVMLPPGEHTYEIVYRTDRQLGFFADHDELYWNVTGNGWDFPIDRATAEVVLPAGVPRDRIGVEAYTGPQGTRGQDYRARVDAGVPVFETTRALAARDGLTIVATWPKGYVTAPGGGARLAYLLRDARPAVLAVAGLAILIGYYIAIWRRVGRDPPARIVVPHYEPPAGESPAAMRYLRSMRYDDRTFAAAVLSLAVKGGLVIEQENTGLFGRRNKYTLARATPPHDTALAADESALLEKLFVRGNRLELDDKNHVTMRAARSAHESALKRTYTPTFFRINGGWHLLGILLSLAIAGIAVVLPAVRGGYDPAWFAGTPPGWTALAAIVAGLVTNGLFGRLLKAPTVAGRKVMDAIEGFRLYLDVAEGDELKLVDAPPLTPALFESNLPAALALGVEQHWAERFATVFATQAAGYAPHWYQGDRWNTSDIGHFSASFGSSFDSAISSASTAPGSSSGSGGGGSSGGGGGGGGGGGW
jgi:uncharacterized membrane protein YgcG